VNSRGRFYWLRDSSEPRPCGILCCMKAPPKRFVVGALTLAAWLSCGGGRLESADSRDIEFFETRIRPVLVEHCGECHLDGKTKGGLRMDSRGTILAGGDSGTSAVPGDPEASPLIRAVRYGDPDLRMPPRHRLAPGIVRDLEEWVRRGLPDPRPEPGTATAAKPAANVDPSRTRQHWAFLPLARPAIPEGEPETGALDRFLRERLRKEGLDFSGPTDRRTWLRRVTQDLTGLPATAEDIAAFESDDRPDAREQWMERLLASPAYGERWGRWWLDVARYADTNGQDENKVMGNAWRYRDWVVASLNADMPFDQFAREQIAGDLFGTHLAPGGARFEACTATGFLVLGPKLLAEQDKPKLVLDIIDEQIDTVGRAFLGLTLGCARCHDHKFDPVPQRDYYAMAGIFASTRTMENLAFVSKFNERPLAPEPEVERVAAHAVQFREAMNRLEKAEKQAKGKDGKPPADPTVTNRIPALKAEVERLKAMTPKPLPKTLAVSEASSTNLPVLGRGSHLNPGKEPVPRGFPTLLGSIPVPPPASSASGRMELALWLTHSSNPLTPRVVVNRVWQAHFGEGLVRTPDNFGLRGELPTHPELLDWLAGEFVRSGWSLKWLHRQIVLSRAYGQSSVIRTDAAGKDPDNRWLHRYPVQRLEAEMLRDAILDVAGRLDRTLGGTVVDWQNDEYVPGDEAPFGSVRRALYLPVVRDRGYDLFTAFDGANSSVAVARRSSTVVSPQALYLLNAPLVRDAADRLVQTLKEEPEASRLRALYRRVLGRGPGAVETERARELLSDARLAGLSEVQRWTVLAHALLCSNEFTHRE